jgi:hypothetical protein
MKKTERTFADDLKQSAANREEMVRRFGFVPTSVIREISRGKLSRRMFIYQHEEAGRSSSNKRLSADEDIASEESKKRHRDRVAAGKAGGGSVVDRKVRSKEVRDRLNADKRKAAAAAGRDKIALAGYTDPSGRLAASIMPAEFVDFFVKYYSEPGAMYLDPFAGQGVRLQVAKLRGLNYIGSDLSAEFVRYIRAFLPKIAGWSDSEVKIIEGDSRLTAADVDDAIGDFCFTSPPYWDVEYYGDEPEQLGRGTYEEFLDGLKSVAEAWRPKFKPNATIVINVNDFKRDGRFIPYHSDTIRIFSEAGYRLDDVWIVEGLVGGLRRVFGVDSNLKRIAPKVHEYAIVFGIE